MEDVDKVLKELGQFDEWNCNTVGMIKLITKLKQVLPIIYSQKSIIDEYSMMLENVDKDNNGIYISKEEANELLEALEEMNYTPLQGKRLDKKGFQLAYNKLYKALGGQDGN